MQPVTAQHLESLLERYPALAGCKSNIRLAFELLCQCYSGGGKLLACGNGGSSADADHLVGELMNRYLFNRVVSPAERSRLEECAAEDAPFLAGNLQRSFPAISLSTNGSVITAVSNDIDPSMIFAQQVYGYGRPGDLLVAFSTSGNSRNVILAARAARARDMKIVGLSGQSGAELKGLCDCCICVPETVTFRVQELHLPVYHALCAMVEQECFGVEIVK